MDIQAKARENMVESQIRPNGVSDTKLLEAYRVIPREKFLPEEKAATAYIDEDINLENSRFLMDPATHARMVQALNIGQDDVVLDVACMTGYSSAIVSCLAKTVVALSSDPSASSQARSNCEALSLYNIVFFDGDLSQCNPEYAPYDAIIFNGSLPELPDNVLDKLNPGGRLAYIERHKGQAMGRAMLLHKLGDRKYSKLTLFDIATPYLPGFKPKEDFVF